MNNDTYSKKGVIKNGFRPQQGLTIMNPYLQKPDKHYLKYPKFVAKLLLVFITIRFPTKPSFFPIFISSVAKNIDKSVLYHQEHSYHTLINQFFQ